VSWLLEFLGGLFGAAWQRRFFRSRVERSEEPWRDKARAQQELVVPLDLDSTEARCHRVLASIGEERERALADDDGSIEAVTPGNWRSTGTVVRLELQPVAGGTKISVTAWPGAALFDWGESRRVARLVSDRLV
jgi:hypothetical protein